MKRWLGGLGARGHGALLCVAPTPVGGEQAHEDPERHERLYGERANEALEAEADVTVLPQYLR